MADKIRLILSTISIIIFIFAYSVRAETEAEGFLFEFGKRFYEQGDDEEALHEFNKVLILNPQHVEALHYIELIKTKIGQKPQPKKETTPSEMKEPQVKLEEREKAIDETLKELEKKLEIEKKKKIIEEPKAKQLEKKPLVEEKVKLPEEKQPAKLEKVSPIKISGQARMSLGINSQDAIWKQANFDLNEKNERSWRMMSEAALNKYENTYDPGIYDRLRFNIDTENNSGFNFHTNITIDPWSFIGKSNKITVVSNDGDDSVEFEVLYWSNSGYTVNQTFYTLRLEDFINLPEIKVVGGRILPTSVSSKWQSNTFSIPELDIHKEFWPIREFWFDYKTDETLNFRFFPIAYQDQAYTSDDPLGLSNHHIWWEESPWLSRWKPGTYQSGARVFIKGKWDDALSFFTRDSDGTRLTGLRGFSFDFNPFEDTTLVGTFASSKELWQDYESFDTFPGALRLKHILSDNLNLGALYTYHLGFDKGSVDASNHVLAVDSNVQPIPGLKMSFEVATSKSRQDETTTYKTKQRGNAFYFSIIGNPANEDILSLNYNQIKPKKGDDAFLKTRFFLSHMDDGFDASLANYHETRNDTFWSRHIHFRKPFEYRYTKLYSPTVSWYDIEPFRIGDSIDTGRDVIGLRAELALFDERLKGLGDIRNAHYTNGKYIETVSRTEWTYKITDAFTSKLFFLNHDLPKTKKGFDPFVFDSDLNMFLVNDNIPDGEDPSLKTGSAGFEYRFNDFLALSGIYERTNDVTEALDNFPRGIYNDIAFTTYWQDGMRFRREKPYLYGQANFPLPPYPYFDIFKAGIQLNPTDELEIYLDWTRNEFESAGQIDNNMNHAGLEVAYMPTDKLNLLFKYVYSIANDIVLINKSDVLVDQNHNNFYGAVRYRISNYDQLMFEYGVGGYTPTGTISMDPYGGSLLTLDTQHIIRIYYTKKF